MAPLTQTENSQPRQNQLNLNGIRQGRPDLPLTVICSTPEETFALGITLAVLLKEGSVVALKGPLGVGKTCLAKGIARGLRVEEELTSPSYTIISEYSGIISEENAPQKKNPVRIYHIDAYRLGGNDDFSAIGGEEIVFGNGISIIEWSENIPGFIPDKALKVDMNILEDQKRHIRVYEEDKTCPEENSK